VLHPQGRADSQCLVGPHVAGYSSRPSRVIDGYQTIPLANCEGLAIGKIQTKHLDLRVKSVQVKQKKKRGGSQTRGGWVIEQ
jgi:hypothetical protein